MSETWTVKRLLEWTTDFLKKQGRESARLDAEILLAAALGCQRIELYTNFETEPPEEKKTLFRDYVKRRAAGEPVAYLVGQKEFYSLAFKVDRSVLIPRPETELLVVEALDWIKKQAGRPESKNGGFRICDMGTGSGAIAVAVAKHAANGRITAVDQCRTALALAAENAKKHQLESRITFLESDLFGQIDEEFDLILSNPPYISRPEYEQLSSEVRDYEPRAALLAGEKGTETIERLLPQAAERLRPGGVIMIEVSPMIADAVAGLFDGETWIDVRIVKDLAGLKRIVGGSRSTITDLKENFDVKV